MVKSEQKNKYVDGLKGPYVAIKERRRSFPKSCANTFLKSRQKFRCLIPRRLNILQPSLLLKNIVPHLYPWLTGEERFQCFDRAPDVNCRPLCRERGIEKVVEYLIRHIIAEKWVVEEVTSGRKGLVGWDQLK